jgi:hypothetical protein
MDASVKLLKLVIIHMKGEVQWQLIQGYYACHGLELNKAQKHNRLLYKKAKREQMMPRIEVRTLSGFHPGRFRRENKGWNINSGPSPGKRTIVYKLYFRFRISGTRVGKESQKRFIKEQIVAEQKGLLCSTMEC